MALLPIMYKMGVGTTLLGVLTFIAIKTMFMVSILFILAISSFAKHKLSSLSSHSGIAYVPIGPPPSYHQPHKEVHVHVHADPHKQAYGSWHRYGSHGPHATLGDSNYHPVYSSAYPPHHSEDNHYYESEPASYYHRRVGMVGGGLPVTGSALGSLNANTVAALSALGNLGQLGSLGAPGYHAPVMSSRWDAGEPAYYTGSYS